MIYVKFKERVLKINQNKRQPQQVLNQVPQIVKNYKPKVNRKVLQQVSLIIQKHLL
jgi:hypothetical protein